MRIAFALGLAATAVFASFPAEARAYAPDKGRFLTADGHEGEEIDPITLNRYAYANDDPVQYDDPSGNDASIAELSMDFDMAVATIGLPGRSGGGAAKEVQITIDDAPQNADAEMRALLAQYGIKTMFFVEGVFVQARPEMTREILADGHKLGNHTWNHERLTTLSDAGIKTTLQRTEDVVRTSTGTSMKPNWRPPGNYADARVEKVASSIGYTRRWHWDVDSEDWKTPGQTGVILSKVESQLRLCPKQRCQILFHDKPSTVNSLRVILPTLQSEGYKLVSFP